MSDGRRSARTATGLFVLGVLLLQGLWLVSVPPFDGVDEIDHAFRATAVAGGQVLDRRHVLLSDARHGVLTSVRADLAAAARRPCAEFSAVDSASCRPTASLGHDRVLIASSAATYDPVGYVPLAIGSAFGRGVDALYAMRVAGALACTLALGAAFFVTRRRSVTQWPGLALLLVLTPMTVALSTDAAPTGLNLAAAVGLWAALLGYYRPTRQERPGVGPLVLAGVLAALMPSTHSLSLGWLPVVLLSVWLFVGTEVVRQRFRGAPRVHLWVAGLVALAWLGAAAWVGVAHTNDTSGLPVHPRLSLWPRLSAEIVLWPLQMVGAFPTFHDPAAPATYGLWFPVLALVLVLGLRHAPRGVRLLVVAMLLLSYLVAVVLTVATYPKLGLAWQGRYSLPLVVGIPLLLAECLERHRVVVPRLVPAVAVLCLAGAQVAAMHGLIAKTAGTEPWRSLPHWPVPSTVALVLAALAVTVAWTLSLRRAEA